MTENHVHLFVALIGIYLKLYVSGLVVNQRGNDLVSE